MVALTLNSCIGGGIFGVPTVAASLVGKGATLAWLVGGIANGLVMACYAEVGSRFREAGGTYIFARRAMGQFAGIQIGWFVLLVRIVSAAAVATVFASYLSGFIPAVYATAGRALVLAVVLGALALSNIVGVRSGTVVSNVVTLSKLAPLVLFAITGGMLALARGPAAAAPMAAVAHPQWMRAILLMGYAYGGYDTAIMPLSEAKDPQRDVPFAIAVALAAMMALFITIQAVSTYWIGMPLNDHPLADAAQQFLGGAGATVISLGALISCFGHMSANVLSVPRVSYALAQNGDFPGFLGIVHRRYRTPWISIVAFAATVWAFASFGSFSWNAFVSSAGRLVMYSSVAVALLIFRRKGPSAPFKMPAGILIAVLTIAICGLLAAQMRRGELYVLLITTALGAATWLWARAKAA